MKISKQIKTELATAYNCAMQVSILDMKAPLRYINQYIAENVSGYGTAADEKVKSREDYRKLLMKSRQQSKGMLFIAKIITPYRPKYINETTAQFHDEIMIEIGDKKNKHSIHLNMSCVFTYQSDKWQMVLFHGSMPDATSTTEDTFHIGEAEKKVKELEKVVAQRTLDLQAKNKELELEAALERVRTVTMAMNTASDILNICQVFFKELKALGFKDLRNALINFWDDKNGLLHDYDYSDFAGGNFAKLPYSSHPAFAEFQKKIRKAKDAFAKLVIKKDGLKSWQQRRRNSGEYKDSRLDKISALYYYFYSTGVGALGISTFNPISKEKVEMLKKFRNVFDLAYKRYVDIAKAEAQAREAQIEAALERVRSRSMAMHHTSELQEVIHTVHKELLNLNLTIDGGSFIVINSNVGPELRCWGSGGTANTSAEVQIPHFNMAFGKNLIEGIKGGPKFFTEEFSRQQKKNFFTKLFKQKPWADLPAKQKKQKLAAPGGYTRSVAVSKHTSIFIINHEGRKFTDTENDLLKRFAKVFEQTYTRFLDLQKAEAQAREAQIQLALERVRARTMAMHISNELGEVAVLLFKQVKELGIESYASGFNIWDKEHKNLVSWMSNPTGSINPPFEMPIHSHEQHRWIYDAWKKHEAFLEHDIKGKAIIKHYQFLRSFPLLDEAFNNSEAAGIKTPDRQVHNIATFSQGYLLFITLEPKPEFRDIFIRFAKVFEQTYTRFLDLQKAEAQAREAQIQLALERVRAKTMAMQNSAELASTAELLFLEFQKLVQQQLIQTTIGIYNEAANEIEFRATHWEGGGLQVEQPAYGSMDEPTLLKPIAMAWRAKEKSLVVELSGKNLKGWVKYRNKMAGVSISSKDTNGKRVISIAFFSRGHLSLSSALPLPEETVKILERFANAFDGTYTRFLDLQKAEAQAREAEIELALERVRARTMAMQKSDELSDAVYVLFQQFKELGENPDQATIGVINENEKVIVYWVTMYGQPINKVFKFSIDELHVTNKIYKAWKENKKSLVIDLSGKALLEFMAYRADKGGAAVNPDEKRRIFNVAFFSKGVLIVQSIKECSEESIKLLEKFAAVFEQTYTRFLDLQKAEEQAREAEIELALERVRARTMAMQKSEELKEVIREVYEQLIHLNILVEHAGFLMDYKERDDLHIWLADNHLAPSEVTLPWFDSIPNNSIKEAKDNGQDTFKYLLDFEEKNKFYRDLFKLIPGVPEETLEYYFNCAGLAGSGVLLENIGLYIENFEGTPYSDDENKILMRFGKVFQQTYTRFLDLQKAEAQARQSQIEASLERVRSRSLAMHKSEELQYVVDSIIEQFKELKLELDAANIVIFDDSAECLEMWTATSTSGSYSIKFLVPYRVTDYVRNVVKTRQEGKDLFKVFYTKEGKDKFFTELFEKTNFNELPEERKKYIFNSQCIALNIALIKNVGIQVISYSRESFSDADMEILKRFSKVFDQAYTRFLDLQKAEAQAREAQIEAALEKIRSRSLAMHKSEELLEVINIISDQLTKLNIYFDNVSFGINELADDFKFWLSSSGQPNAIKLQVPYMANPAPDRVIEAQKNGVKFFSDRLTTEENQQWLQHLIDHTELKSFPEKVKNYIFNSPGFARSTFILKNINFYIGNYKDIPYTHEENDIFRRFAESFEQSYIRFLDLQKAEAQAREAQIEAALEKVRSRTMAMRDSSELLQTAEILFDQMRLLGAELQGVAFAICDKDSMMVQKWTSIGIFSHPYNIDPGEQRMYEAWKNQSGMYEEVYEGEKQKKYFEAFMKIPAFREGLQKMIDAGHPIPAWQKNYAVPFQQGYLLIITTKPFEETQIFLRFGKVFEQTYTRFLDLQKAEAQAREAKIESAMEKVRARALAMQKADELIEVAQVLRREMGLLGIEELETSSIYIQNESTGKTECWYAIKNEEKLVADHMTIDLNDSWVGRQMHEFYRSDKKQVSIVMQGANRKEWINYCSEKSKALSGFYGDNIPDRTYHLYKFSNGYMGAASPGDISAESWDLLQRATNVFSLAYTRFSDLQQAEAATKEAVKQAALDRIRADIAAMRTAKDLERITPLIWNELTILKVPFVRCGVFIMDNEKELIHTFLSTPDGKAIAAIHIPFSTPGKTRLIPENWKKKTPYTDHWTDNDFIDFATALKENHAFESSETYLSGIPHGGFYLHFLPFLQGMLYVGNPTQLHEDETDLIQVVADAFSSAYSRYEDFNKLEVAKKQVDNALAELQATQKQLIQSEKMASLGELTAGIAHEIQNPLNFVNNFSEVSKELLDEMREAIEKGDTEDAKEIMNDVIQNLEKINHHGKRADGIVKGMLQHSRSSSGQKELTDINALCDEYLRLSYHGLRAKDKSFNAKFETDFDAAFPKINVVPQDIGRVILNLINNAFYAVNERKKLNETGYDPTIWVSTKRVNDKIEISVKDNGIGIPEKIKEKIFQPFFTTKPTGSGTGLGLSLSYDIVKSHGGEIKIESKENEGTEFKIVLPII